MILVIVASNISILKKYVSLFAICFPMLFFYNHLVELEREVAIPLTLFIKKVLLGKCMGISFVFAHHWGL